MTLSAKIEKLNDEQKALIEKKIDEMLQKINTLPATMDIYSPSGTKIRYVDSGGYPSDLEHARKHLIKDQVYTVVETDVGGWSTDVYIEEVPNLPFNSVHFVKV